MSDEHAFLERITAVPGDDETRQVYADWLTERGDRRSLARAAFLRAQAEGRRLPRSAGPTKDGWLARVDRTAIEGCETAAERRGALRFDFECPERWEALEPGDDPRTRHCAACQERVHWCADIAEAQWHARSGRCIAISSLAPRRPGDLQALSIRMGRIAPPRRAHSGGGSP